MKNLLIIITFIHAGLWAEQSPPIHELVCKVTDDKGFPIIRYTFNGADVTKKRKIDFNKIPELPPGSKVKIETGGWVGSICSTGIINHWSDSKVSMEFFEDGKPMNVHILTFEWKDKFRSRAEFALDGKVLGVGSKALNTVDWKKLAPELPCRTKPKGVVFPNWKTDAYMLIVNHEPYLNFGAGEHGQLPLINARDWRDYFAERGMWGFVAHEVIQVKDIEGRIRAEKARGREANKWIILEKENKYKEPYSGTLFGDDVDPEEPRIEPKPIERLD